MKNVLVLGGTSFFGRELVQLLLDHKYSVTIFSRGNKTPEFNGNVEWVHGDRFKREDLKKLANKSFDLAFDQIGFCSQDALLIVEELGTQIKKLVFTSSQSVYGIDNNLKESLLDPLTYKLIIGPREQFDYGEGKRQAEAFYFQNSPFQIAIARPSIVIGPNDLSGRFKFHVDKIARGAEFHLPNPQAKISALRSDDAAKGLLAIAERSEDREVFNLCSTNIVLQELMRTIANAIEGRINYTSTTTDEKFSPYGINEDWWMNRTKIETLLNSTHQDFLDYITQLAIHYENNS